MSLNVTHNVQKFIAEVNRLVDECGLPMMDAVVHVAETTGMEIETAASIVKQQPKLKSKIQIEAEELNYMPKRARLNFAD